MKREGLGEEHSVLPGFAVVTAVLIEAVCFELKVCNGMN
jgi:hypothetical protein